MLPVAVLLFLICGGGTFYFLVRALSDMSVAQEVELATLQGRQAEETAKREKIERGIAVLNITLTRTMKMYEAARDICTFLDEERLFLRFKEDLKKLINFRECRLLGHDEFEVSSIGEDDVLFPLAVQETQWGCLVIRGVSMEDHPYLTILSSHFALGLKRAKLYKLTQELAVTDSLTGLYRRRYAMERLKEEFRRSVVQSLDLSFLMIDIDDFKVCNDTCGHLVGDLVLSEVASRIRENVREVDMLARFGGEEFMVFAPGTSKEGAYQIAERIRREIEAVPVRAYDETLKITVSIGVASYPKDAKTIEDLIGYSDWALYQSKKLGKNKVSIFGTFHESR